ncbi:MAG TPA: DUF3667 domain-containing protein [Flavisolibacter sp.]|jgi:hypothetical protein
MTTTTCLNCRQALQPGHRFCSACGQKADTHRISFKHFLHDLLHGFTHADIGIFHLIKQLALKPGEVARNYLAGQRKRYFPPMNFYLIMIGLFVFTLGLFHTFEQPNNFAQLRADVSKISDAVVRERRMMKLDRAETAMAFMTKKSNLVSLLLATPLAAFVFFLFYIRRNLNYAEHLVSNFYFAGFSALFFILVVGPLVSLVDSQSFYLGAMSAFLFAEMLYRSIAYYQLMNRKGARHYLYALLASITAVGLWILLSQAIVIYYIDHGLPGIFH